MMEIIEGGSGPRVLIIEDNKSLAKVWLMDTGGAHLTIVTTVNEARRQIDHWLEEFVAIFVDGRLEVCSCDPPDTLGLIQHICEQGFTGPLVAISNDDQVREQQLAAGCNDSCTKEVLTDKIRLLLAETPSS